MTNAEERTEWLTKKEYACIHLGVPMTGDEELDSIIRASRSHIYVSDEEMKWTPKEELESTFDPREYTQKGVSESDPKRTEKRDE